MLSIKIKQLIISKYLYKIRLKIYLLAYNDYINPHNMILSSLNFMVYQLTASYACYDSNSKKIRN